MAQRHSLCMFIYIFFICSLAVWLPDLAIVTNTEISIDMQGSLGGVDSGPLHKHQQVDELHRVVDLL